MSVCVCVCVCAGISTDVALTVTENAVGIRRVQSQMEELEKKMTDMHNMIKTAVLGSSCFSLFFLAERSCVCVDVWGVVVSGLTIAALATCLGLGLSHHCTWAVPDLLTLVIHSCTRSLCRACAARVGVNERALDSRLR